MTAAARAFCACCTDDREYDIAAELPMIPLHMSVFCHLSGIVVVQYVDICTEKGYYTNFMSLYSDVQFEDSSEEAGCSA